MSVCIGYMGEEEDTCMCARMPVHVYKVSTRVRVCELHVHLRCQLCVCVNCMFVYICVHGGSLHMIWSIKKETKQNKNKSVS